MGYYSRRVSTETTGVGLPTVDSRYRLHFFAKFLIIAAIYFSLALTGLKFDAVNGFASYIWPPTGFAFAALFIFGEKLWSAIFCGAFFINWYTGAPIGSALCIGVGNMLEALIAVSLLRRAGFSREFSRLNDVILFVLVAALGSTLLSATIGVSSLLMGGVIKYGDIGKTWLAWWLGDVVGDLIVAPVLLVWSTKWVLEKKFKLRKFLEVTLMITVISISSLIILTDLIIEANRTYVRSYFMFPIAMIISMGLRQRALVIANLFIAIVAIWAAIHGQGSFIFSSLNESFLHIQIFLGLLVVSELILVSVVSEREERQQELQESNMQREAILNASQDCVVTIDLMGRILEFNPSAEKLFGYKRREVIGKEYSEILLPHRLRKKYNETVLRSLLEKDGSRIFGQQIEITVLTANGKEIPVELTMSRLDTPGLPKLSAFFRDISSRKQIIAEKKQREETEKFLAEVTERFSKSIDYYTTIKHIVGAAVPRFADYGFVYLFGEDGGVHDVEYSCSIPANEAYIQELISLRMKDPYGSKFFNQVIQEKKSMLLNTFSDKWLREMTTSPRYSEIFHELKVTSLISCPIISG